MLQYILPNYREWTERIISAALTSPAKPLLDDTKHARVIVRPECVFEFVVCTLRLKQFPRKPEA